MGGESGRGGRQFEELGDLSFLGNEAVIEALESLLDVVELLL